MSLTDSTMLPLGTTAPDFELFDTISRETLSLTELKSSVATVIMFICNHCPFVQHVRAELAALAHEYQAKGIVFIAISSNDVDNYPADAPDKMHDFAHQSDFTFPYLYDETQDVAKAYQAACTPEFYVFDQALACVYRGQLDDSRPSNSVPVTGRDLRQALDTILAGGAVSAQQKPSQGCNIKWKS